MGGLFGQKSQPAPAPTAPAPMPDMGAPAVREAKRKATEEAMARAGRASTILSGGGSAAPIADSYGSKTLG